MPTSASSARVLGIGQAGLGVLMIVRPQPVASAAAGSNGRPASRWVIRLLGVRSLLQGAVTAAAPNSVILVAGALVDAAHAASMAPLIAGSPRYRRAAAISAVVATISAGAGALAARNASPTAGAV